VNGEAVLITGASGSGKSSLTAALSLRGRLVLGDDIVLLGPDGHVSPLKRLLKIEEPARTLLGLPPAPEPQATLWPGAAFYHPRDLRSRWADPAPVAAFVLPRRTAGADVGARERSPADILPEVLQGIIASERPTSVEADAAIEALSGARAIELVYDDSAQGTARLLEELS
jgi:hypothetical protein